VIANGEDDVDRRAARRHGSPSPESLSRDPLSTPAGIWIVIERSCRTRPSPRQSAQGSWITRPCPWQRPQGRRISKKPCLVPIEPVPLHCGQRTGCVPGFAPLPAQASQLSRRGNRIVASPPKAAWRKSTSRL
jgi:hypothetical protein